MSKTAHFPKIHFYLNYATASVESLGISLASKLHGEGVSFDIRGICVQQSRRFGTNRSHCHYHEYATDSR
jgi:hypothetical protein